MCASSVCPPDTTNATYGCSGGEDSRKFAYTCPSRWFTPMNGAPVARATDFAAARPTRRAPTRPGPTVTATPSRSAKRRDASSRARSSMGVRSSTWAREASSGTTPPNRPWTSCWLDTRFERIRTPSSTTATAVSSQDVSIPSTFTRPVPPRRAPRSRRAAFPARRRQIGEAFQEVLVLGPVHVVHPHDQGVLVRLLVVVLAHADRAEPEPPVHPLRAPVRHPHLQRHRPGPHVHRRLGQLVHQPRADLAAVVVRVHGDRGHVGLVAVADQPGVAHHIPADPRHQVGPVRLLGHLGQEQAGTPRPRVHLALDGHDPLQVAPAHPADLELSRSGLSRPKRSPHPTSSDTGGPRRPPGRILPAGIGESKARRVRPRGGTPVRVRRSPHGDRLRPARGGTGTRRRPPAGSRPAWPRARRPGGTGAPPGTP